MSETVVERLVYKLEADTQGFADRVEDAEKTITRVTDFLQRRPALAAAAFTAAMVTMAAAATTMAAEVDDAMRDLRSSLSDPNAEIGELQESMEGLATVTPRTTVELSKTAKALAGMGQADPKEIAADLKTLALAADALEQGTDMNGLADVLDQIGDSFELSAEQARVAFVQITAMAKGKVGIDELGGALARSAPQLKAMGVNATDAAAAMILLIDAGIDRRKAVSGTLDLLDRASKAETAALDAAAQGKDEQAAAIRKFGAALSDTNVQSKGLVGGLADLFTALDGNREMFRLVGLSQTDYTIAQKAAASAAEDASKKTLTYEQAVEKLSTAAQVNRESASALATILREELSQQIVALGNVFLPTLIAGLTTLADLFSRTRRAAKEAASDITIATKEFAKTQADLAGANRYAGAPEGIRRAFSFAQKVNQNDEILTSDQFASPKKLREAQLALTQALNAGMGKGVVGENRNAIIQALQAVEDRITALDVAARETGETMDKTGGTITTTGDAAKEAAEKLEQSREAFASLLDSLSDASAAERASAAILKFREDALKTTMPAAELTTRMAALWAAFDQMQDKEASETIAKLATALQQLVADVSGDALDVLAVQFDALTTKITEGAEAAEKAGNTDLAKQYRALLPVVEKQREGLTALARTQKEITAARSVESAALQSANANYKGMAVSVADLHTAQTRLARIQTELTAITKDPAVDPKVRAEAQRMLNDLIREEGDAREEVAGQTVKAGEAVMSVGSGLRDAAQSGLALVQALGKGNSELAQMLAGVTSVGSGIEAMGKAAQTSGGWGKAFTSGSGIMSLLGGAGAILGGVSAITGAISARDEAAKRREEELKQAAKDFNRALQDFVREGTRLDMGELERGAQDLRKEIGDLVLGAIKKSGYDESMMEGLELSSAGIQAYIDSLLAIGDPLNEFTSSYYTLAQSLSGLLPQVIAREEQRAAAIRKQITEAIEDLAVRRLAAQGRTAEAAAMQRQLDAERKLEEARVKYAGAEGYVEYMRALQEVTDAELAAAAAADALAAALSKLDSDEQFLGPDLTRLTATAARLWPEVFATLFADLDLSTMAGLEEAKRRIQEWYKQISADGIDAAEQPMVDFMLRLFGGIERALDGMLSPIDAAIATALERFDIFGTKAADAFTEIGALLAAKFPTLTNILGPTFQQDIQTGEGRERLKTSITTAINAILADGKITGEEAPILAALRQLLALVVGAISDAAEDAQAEADEAAETAATNEANRQERRKQRGQQSELDIALNDLEGDDAFLSRMSSYGKAFGDLFTWFDLNTPEGIAKAGDALKDLRREILSLSDEEIMERFGMTRDEFIAALLDADSGLAKLGDTLAELAVAQTDFLNDLTVEFLNTTGQGLEAVKLQTKLWVDAMIEQAKTLGVWSQQVENQIRTIGNTRIANAAAQATGSQTEAQRLAQEAERRGYTQGVGVRDGALQAMQAQQTQATTARDEFVGSDITRTSNSVALRMTDYLAASLIETQAIRVAAEQAVALLSVLAGGALPALRAPVLPPNMAAGGGGGFTLVVNITGPITGMTPDAAAREFAETALPYLNAALARAAGVEARNAGYPSLS